MRQNDKNKNNANDKYELNATFIVMIMPIINGDNRIYRTEMRRKKPANYIQISSFQNQHNKLVS